MIYTWKRSRCVKTKDIDTSCKTLNLHTQEVTTRKKNLRKKRNRRERKDILSILVVQLWTFFGSTLKLFLRQLINQLVPFVTVEML